MTGISYYSTHQIKIKAELERQGSLAESVSGAEESMSQGGAEEGLRAGPDQAFMGS